MFKIKKSMVWLANAFSQFYFAQILLSGGISWGTIHLAIVNQILNMNSFYYWCIGLVLFYAIFLLNKYFIFSGSKKSSNLETLIKPFELMNASFKFEVIIQEIKGVARHQINAIEQNNLQMRVFEIIDNEDNLILFFRVDFEGYVKSPIKPKILKDSNQSDECEIFENAQTSRVFYSLGVEDYVSKGILAVRIFFEKGGRYKIDFTAKD